ncbi:MAG: helix-turn-helix domain-containing protein [Planctomycetes bacterium]|nr:helix-turn-helix domain-containing protein [Planctomycetota bacterium]
MARARKRLGLTQAELGKRLGVSQQLIARIEGGGGSLDQVARVCRALGLALEVTLDGVTKTLVHALNPDERREIEANIDWFSRLPPLARLKTIARHVKTIERLKKGMKRTSSPVRRPAGRIRVGARKVPRPR